MKFFAFFAVVLSFFAPQMAMAFSASDLETADKYYAEKSWQLAATEYAKFLDEKAEEPLKREVVFKWSDSVVQ
ncbi:MAG: hypothetical protein IT560_12495, partial [Alphaproteobacteria bacterium]|nr:hypothetical protein [Alphaproteobacteria bacterium]